MEKERDHKQELLSVRNELQFRIDELETLLESELNEKRIRDKQMAEQLTTIQQLRDIRDNSVELSEYQLLKQDFDKIVANFKDLQNTNDLLNKRLKSDSNEIELIHKNMDLKIEEIDKLKTSLSHCCHQIEEQKSEINELIGFKESFNDLQKVLDKERIENSKLNELLSVYREEHLKQNESNISVEEFNQSISKFLNSSIGESMDCVLNIKLSELESAFEKKCHDFEAVVELSDKMQTQNQEINKQLIKWKSICEDFESKVEQLSTDCQLISEQNGEQRQKCEDLTKMNETIERQNQLFIKENESIVKEKEILLKELNEEKKKAEKANEELMELESAFEKKCRDFEAIIEMNTELSDKMQTLNEETNKKVIKWKSICEEFESKVEQMSTDCQLISEQNGEQRQKCEDLTKINESIERQNQLFVKENESIVKEKEILLKELNEEKKRAEKANEELMEIDKQFTNLKEKNLNLTQSLTEEQEKSQILKNEVKCCVEEKKYEIDLLIKANNDSKNKVSELESAFEKKCHDFEAVVELSDKMQTQNQEINKQLIKWKSICEDFELKVEQLSTDCQLISEQNGEQRQKCEDLTKINESIERQNQLFVKENETIVKEKEILLKELNEEKKKAEKANEELIELESAFEKKCRDFEAIIEMNTELSDKMQTLNEETNKKVIKWKSICEEFESKVEQMSTDCQLISEQNGEERQKCEDLTKMNQTIERQNQLFIKENESIVKEKEILLKELNEEKKKAEKANEELMEIHSVVDKRFASLKEKIFNLTQSLAEERKKSQILENELQSQQQFQNQQKTNNLKELEKTISDLKTRLNTEEMSFEFERKNKERFAKENEQYCRQIQFLQNEIRKLKELLERPEKPSSTSGAYFCMPTTVNINTTQPNQTAYSVSSMDISNSNSSNISLNISRKLPTGTGSRLAMADEEGEFMDPNHLNALKNGECFVSDSALDEQRMSILQRRNTMVLPHLRASYAVELPFMANDVNEELIKQGFNGNESKTLKQIQNISFQRNEFNSNPRNQSISCDNIRINTNKSYNKRGEVENIRISSSKLSLRNMTPTKMFRRVINKQTWTPNKK